MYMILQVNENKTEKKYGFVEPHSNVNVLSAFMLVVPLICLMVNSINQKHKFHAVKMYTKEKIEYLAFDI